MVVWRGDKRRDKVQKEAGKEEKKWEGWKIARVRGKRIVIIEILMKQVRRRIA